MRSRKNSDKFQVSNSSSGYRTAMNIAVWRWLHFFVHKKGGSFLQTKIQSTSYLPIFTVKWKSDSHVLELCFRRFRSEFFHSGFILIDLHTKCSCNVNSCRSWSEWHCRNIGNRNKSTPVTSHQRRLDITSFANSEFHLLNIRVIIIGSIIYKDCSATAPHFRNI
jgi:hypothetical protein